MKATIKHTKCASELITSTLIPIISANVFLIRGPVIKCWLDLDPVHMLTEQ